MIKTQRTVLRLPKCSRCHSRENGNLYNNNSDSHFCGYDKYIDSIIYLVEVNLFKG